MLLMGREPFHAPWELVALRGQSFVSASSSSSVEPATAAANMNRTNLARSTCARDGTSAAASASSGRLLSAYLDTKFQERGLKGVKAGVLLLLLLAARDVLTLAVVLCLLLEAFQLLAPNEAHEDPLGA